MKRIFITVCAVLFLILGLIGLALPFLQGFLFILIGVVLLSLVSERFKNYAESHTRKYPKVHAVVEKIKDAADRYIGKI